MSKIEIDKSTNDYDVDALRASLKSQGGSVTLNDLCEALRTLDISESQDHIVATAILQLENSRAALDFMTECKDEWYRRCCKNREELDLLRASLAPVDPQTLSLKDLWCNFDVTYHKFQSDLYAFWGAIDVGDSRSYFADLYSNMRRLRRDLVSMLPDEVRNK